MPRELPPDVFVSVFTEGRRFFFDRFLFVLFRAILQPCADCLLFIRLVYFLLRFQSIESITVSSGVATADRAGGLPGQVSRHPAGQQRRHVAVPRRSRA